MAKRSKSAALPIVATLLLSLGATILSTTPLVAGMQQKKQAARTQFDKAEAARTDLEAKPESKRRIADYDAVIKLYNAVPLLSPMVHQAPDSMFEAAKLSQAVASRFPKDAPKYRADAKRLYQTLLKQYPTTHYRKDCNQALAMMDTAEDERAAVGAREFVPPTLMPAPAAVTPVSAPAPSGKLVMVSNIREWSTPSYTRVVIDVDEEIQFEAGRIANPDRIYFDLHNTKLVPALKDHNRDVDDGLLKKIRLGVNRAGITRVVLEVGQVTTYSAFLLPNPYRLVIDIQGATKPTAPATMIAATTTAATTTAANTVPDPTPVAVPPASAPAPQPTQASVVAPPVKPKRSKVTAPAVLPTPEPVENAPLEVAKNDVKPDSQEIPSTAGPSTEPVFEKVRKTPTSQTSAVLAPEPASNGQRSLTRALGLKIGRIVIDAGHGGHDTGTVGPTGYAEKDLVLDVALRLGELVQQRLGSEVVYTRSDDTFVPLEMRTAIANQKQADLFVSVHANASRDAKARGIETYYLSFSTSQDTLEVAARENSVSEKSIHELQDLVKKITLYEKVEESKEFAADVQKSMYTNLSRGNTALHNRGVRKAPFVVLIGANMPSILAEISFVSNPQDEKMLRKPEYRQRIAESLFRGIQHYANSLGGVKVATQRGDATFE